MSLSCKEQGRLADAELELEECTSCLVRSEKYQELYLGRGVGHLLLQRLR